MKLKTFMQRILILLIIMSFICSSQTGFVHATQEDFNNEAEERKSEPVESNDIDGWPEGPVNGAQSAILMDADSGAILYAKNIDDELFPASTTKIMTCLVAIENCSLDEVITVNQSAIDANDPDGSNMGLRAGDKLTLEELLYGILINSANEACNAVAEHIAGSQEAFVDMMNAKAKELGCTHTHFVTTNGLSDDEHYTSSRDLALIGREFFKYDILCKISSTGQYTIPENSMHREFYLLSHNKLTKGREYAYDSLVGSKTGFTSISRQTLVSCAENNGMKLICVILREESPNQFTDTIALFDYGFNNFSKINVQNNETKYNIKQPAYLSSGLNLYGYNHELITIDSHANVIIPKNNTFDQLDSSVVYGKVSDPNAFATIEYYYNGAFVGSADIIINSLNEVTIANEVSSINSEEAPVIFNIRNFMISLTAIMTAIILFMIFGGAIKKAIDNQVRLAKIRKARKENEPKRRPTHRKYKKHEKPEESDTKNGFSKKRKHTVYRKPEVVTLYDKDAKKPGNRASKNSYEQSLREKRRKEFFDNYERIDIDIDED